VGGRGFKICTRTSEAVLQRRRRPAPSVPGDEALRHKAWPMWSRMMGPATQWWVLPDGLHICSTCLRLCMFSPLPVVCVVHEVLFWCFCHLLPLSLPVNHCRTIFRALCGGSIGFVSCVGRVVSPTFALYRSGRCFSRPSSRPGVRFLVALCAYHALDVLAYVAALLYVLRSNACPARGRPPPVQVFKSPLIPVWQTGDGFLYVCGGPVVRTASSVVLRVLSACLSAVAGI
jgi:hypothetical protein